MFLSKLTLCGADRSCVVANLPHVHVQQEGTTFATTTYTVQHCVLTCIYGLVDAIESHIHVHEILLVVRHQVLTYNG